jgi:hypothetical protein
MLLTLTCTGVQVHNSRKYMYFSIYVLLLLSLWKDPFLVSNIDQKSSFEIFILYISGKQILRCELNREVQFLFIRSRLHAINGCIVELQISVSLSHLWLVFECYQVVSLKDALSQRGVDSMPPLCFFCENKSWNGRR